MMPIHLSGRAAHGGYDYAEFKDRFLEICLEHRAKGRALAFAFILFDFDDPETRKVLRDTDYWSALDKISGQFLTVFSFNVPQASRGRDRSLERANRFVQKKCGLDLLDPMPAILFFQVTDEGLLDSYAYKFGDATIAAMFREIRDVLTAAVESVERVLPEHRRNSAQIFNFIHNRLWQTAGFRTVRKIAGVIDALQAVLNKLGRMGANGAGVRRAASRSGRASARRTATTRVKS